MDLAVVGDGLLVIAFFGLKVTLVVEGTDLIWIVLDDRVEVGDGLIVLVIAAMGDAPVETGLRCNMT